MVSQKKIELYINADGVNNSPLEISSFRYDIKRMGGAPTISCTLMYESCLDNVWNDNVYALFNGEKFYLKQTPTSSKSNTDGRYKHDVELVSERIILDNTYYFDAVIGTPLENDKPTTNSTKFNFHGNIEEFVKKMNSSLQYTKLQKVESDGSIRGYNVILDEGITSENKQIAFDDAAFSQALQECYNSFGIPFYFDGKDIHVGFTNNAINQTLEYGVDDALLSINKNNSNFKVVNRAAGEGSEENLPYFYPNNSPKGEIDAVSSNPELEVTIKDYEKYANEVSIDSYVEYKSHKYTIGKTYFKRTPRAEEEEYTEGVQVYSINNGRNHVTSCLFETEVNTEGTTSFYFYPNIMLSKAVHIFPDREKEVSNVQIKYNAYIYEADKPDEKIWSIDEFNVGEKLKIDIYKKGVFRIVVNISFEHSEFIAYGQEFRAYFTYNKSFIPETNWYLDERVVDLSSLGLSFVGTPQNGDTITQLLVKKVNESKTLQPSIYRATDGKERFYNAKNYPFIKESAYELQYGEYVVNGYVHNDVFKKDDGTYYEFATPYIEGHPREHVFTVDDIKPTIKEMTNDISWVEKDKEGKDQTIFQRVDMFSEFAYDEDDNDETYIAEDKSVNFKHPYFFAKLRKLPFNLFEHASENGAMTISMTSGHTGACNFEIGVSEDEPQYNPVQIYEEDTTDEKGVFHPKGSLKRDEEGRVLCGLEDFQGEVPMQPIQQDTVNNEVWIALKKEEDTYGILMPKAPANGVGGHRPVACSSEHSNDGDTFVITNITLPEEYILEAEKKLEKAIVKYIWENNVEKFNFSINFSRIFLEENEDFRDKLNENARLNVRYNGKDYLLYVSSFSYQMNDGDILPNVTVELDDTLTIAQNSLQRAIDGVKSEIGKVVNSIDVAALGTKYFLRKDVDDSCESRPTFKRGVSFGNGGDINVNNDGSAKLTIDYLEVTRRATFTSLEIQEKTHVGGQILLSPAAMTCSNVVEVRDTNGNHIAWRCYFQTKGDNGEEIFNTFVVDDQVICQTYNAWGSKFYWRLVTEVGKDYIDISVEDCAPESDIPAIGDKIIQLGNRTNTSRQAAQVLSAYGEDAPSFIMYNGIDSFSLEGKNVTGIMWDPEKEEPQMYSYGDFFFGDRKLENDFITFQKKEGDDRKKLHINADVTIGANSSGLENLSEWQSKQAEIDDAKNEANTAKKNAAKAQTTADTALTNAQEAQSVANSASARLNEWASDGIISPVEKQALKNELAVVNSDYDDIHKQYEKYIQEFDKFILTDGKYYVTEDGYIFNVEVANSNWSSFRSAYQSYVAELTLKTSTSESVEVGYLTAKQNAYYSARTAMLEDISLSIKAEADYSKKQANQAIQDASEARGIADTANASVTTLGTRIDGVDKTIAEINNKLDGVVESYFDDYIPSRDNLPASEWVGTEADHVGDTFTNTALEGEGAGQSWRWLEQADGSYDWQQIADSDAAKALALAGQAKAAADGKTKTFLVTPTNYNVGDIWIVGDTVPEGFAFKKGDILTTNSASAAYVAIHWSKVINYNDEFQSTLDAKVGELNDAIDNVEQNANDYTDDARTALQNSINALNEAKANIKDVYTKAESDGMISESEQRAIDAASDYAQKAQENAEINVKAWADGEIKQAEQDAIDASNASLQQAKNELDEALRDLESEVDGVRALANNAQTIASSATSKLNQWSADNVISPLEKQGLKDEIAFIKADYNDISLQYEKYILEFDTLILQDGKQYITEDGYVFNVEVANTNWTAYKSAYNAYKEDLESKTADNETVAIGNLTTLQVAFYNKRTAILEDISLSIKAEADYSKKTAQKASEDVENLQGKVKSDYDYLTEIFGKGNNLSVQGAVMTQMVAVADVEEGEDVVDVVDANVKAIFNGSSEIYDDEHGTLILAGGIPESTSNGKRGLVERAKEAATRIYEDGCTFTKKMHLEDGCTIGDFSIDENAIQINGCDSLGAGHTVSVSKHGFRTMGTSNDGSSCKIERIVEVSGKGDAEALILLETKEEDEIAIKIAKGYIAGLRPKIRVVSSNTEVFSDDHTIMVNSSYARTIQFPSNPQIGQEYEFLFTNKDDTNVKHKFVSADDSLINNPCGGDLNKESLEVGAYGACKFIYLLTGLNDYRWWFYRLR